MTRVNRMMAYDFESNTSNEDFNEKKQIPSIATRLTAEVYFKPKKAYQESSAMEVSAANIAYFLVGLN